jgi:hypothetical protein
MSNSERLLVSMVYIRSSSVIVVKEQNNGFRLPKSFKRVKVIAIPKPGKDGSDPAHYRTLSLLSVMYKLLELVILQLIQPLNKAATPVHQAGFRKNRSCTDQVMTITTHIEAGFQPQLKTGVVFVDRPLCKNF